MDRFNIMGDDNEFDICPTCAGEKEEKARLREEEERTRQATSVKQARIASRLKECSIGERFMGMKFSDYLPTCDKAAKVFGECCRYVEGFKDQSGANLMMIGSPGTGKNMLAAIIG